MYAMYIQFLLTDLEQCYKRMNLLHISFFQSIRQYVLDRSHGQFGSRNHICKHILLVHNLNQCTFRLYKIFPIASLPKHITICLLSCPVGNCKDAFVPSGMYYKAFSSISRFAHTHYHCNKYCLSELIRVHSLYVIFCLHSGPVPAALPLTNLYILFHSLYTLYFTCVVT